MAAFVLRRFNLGYLKIPQYGLFVPSLQNLPNIDLVRHHNKHWKPEFKKLRRKKVMKINLPKQDDDEEEMSKEKVRKKMKEYGLLPPRPWIERSVVISSTGGIFEPYVPPEGDGKMSLLSGGGAKQSIVKLEKKSKSMMAIRKVRSFDDDFEVSDFCNQAQDIYIKAHTCLAKKDKTTIGEYITERCYPEFLCNIQSKTINWKFIKSLEPPRVVHARNTSLVTKDNLFAQLTVRFHTQQQLAIYDRFGRLLHGSEIIAKDVLEYIVFEKHLSNLYGTWRIHDKIIPDWLPPREPVAKTFCKPEEPVEDEVSQKDANLEKAVVEPDTPESRPLATA